VTDPASPPGPPPRPRSLILTVYGAFLRGLGGWVAIADLITLMGALDVDAQAVRSSMSRLKRRGALRSQRRRGTVGYVLSDEGHVLFDEGDRRIYGRRGPSRLEDGWVLAVFSVPESEREKRHVLRSRLAWLGYGNASAGVWVAPAHLLDDTRATLERLDLNRFVHLFRADYVGFADPGACVRQWWDLDLLERTYDDYAREHEPLLEAWSAGSPGGWDGSDEAAFRGYVLALTQWRRMPYLDPGLPAALLPRPWAGSRAAAVFDGLTALLHEPGLRHVQKVTGLPVEDGRDGQRRSGTAVESSG